MERISGIPEGIDKDEGIRKNYEEFVIENVDHVPD